MGQGPKKIKLYEALLDLGLAESEDKAKAMIMAGQVIVGDQRADKAGQMVLRDAPIRVKGKNLYVSRGGFKLAYAIEDFNLKEQVSDLIALDIGASTGGFTDCLLQHGARKVFALDVGTNQLAWSLRNDSRVTAIEKTDIRSVTEPIDPDISLVVADVSFNSLSRLLPAFFTACPNQGVQYLLLIKPQFELSSNKVPEGGVVVDDGHRLEAVEKVKESLLDLGISSFEVKDCRLPGKTGNREIFIYFKK